MGIFIFWVAYIFATVVTWLMDLTKNLNDVRWLIIFNPLVAYLGFTNELYHQYIRQLEEAVYKLFLISDCICKNVLNKEVEDVLEDELNDDIIEDDEDNPEEEVVCKIVVYVKDENLETVAYPLDYTESSRREILRRKPTVETVNSILRFRFDSKTNKNKRLDYISCQIENKDTGDLYTVISIKDFITKFIRKS